MSNAPTDRTEIENVRAANIEAEKAIECALARVRYNARTEYELRTAFLLIEALDALRRAKQYIIHFHPNGQGDTTT